MEVESPERATPAVRERLLSAALELFRMRGYAATTVREIVEAAGVTKPVLYYWFGNKEGIYLELMNGTYATFQTMLAGAAQLRGNARERILSLSREIFDMFVENIDVARLIYSIFFGAPQGAPEFPHEEYFDKMLETFRALVREGIAAGEFRGEDGDITWGIVSSLNTIMEEQLCRRPPRIGREGLMRVQTLVLNGAAHGGKG
jgi:TetR/AcrR family transcriptional regulator